MNSLRQSLKRRFVPELPSKDPQFSQGMKAIVFASWLNVLLLFIPLSWAFNLAKPDDHVLIFILSFLAITPLAKLLALAANEMSLRVGQTLAGLLNATLGNTIEVVVAIIAIMKCELQVVQSSLIGSILSNLLLVSGMCFFVGGLRFQGHGFGSSGSQINLPLLTLSVIAVLLPGAVYLSVKPSSTSGEKNIFSNGDDSADIKKLSHGIAIILLLTSFCGSYIVLQLPSHPGLEDDKHTGGVDSTQTHRDSITPKADSHTELRSRMHRNAGELDDVEKNANGNTNVAAGHGATSTDGMATGNSDIVGKAEDEVKHLMSFATSLGLLVIVIALIIVTSVWLVDSINGLTDGTGLTKEWVGLFLLPIVGIAAHVTAIANSVKEKLTFNIGVAITSSIQTALFVIPLMVVIAWTMGKPLPMLFDPFESISLFFAILTVSFVAPDRKSSCLEGMVLMSLYVMMVICFFFYPGSEVGQALEECT